jgi:hypothetical protein
MERKYNHWNKKLETGMNVGRPSTQQWPDPMVWRGQTQVTRSVSFMSFKAQLTQNRALASPDVEKGFGLLRSMARRCCWTTL